MKYIDFDLNQNNLNNLNRKQNRLNILEVDFDKLMSFDLKKINLGMNYQKDNNILLNKNQEPFLPLNNIAYIYQYSNFHIPNYIYNSHPQESLIYFYFYFESKRKEKYVGNCSPRNQNHKHYIY